MSLHVHHHYLSSKRSKVQFSRPGFNSIDAYWWPGVASFTAAGETQYKMHARSQAVDWQDFNRLPTLINTQYDTAQYQYIGMCVFTQMTQLLCNADVSDAACFVLLHSAQVINPYLNAEQSCFHLSYQLYLCWYLCEKRWNLNIYPTVSEGEGWQRDREVLRKEWKT